MIWIGVIILAALALADAFAEHIPTGYPTGSDADRNPDKYRSVDDDRC